MKTVFISGHLDLTSDEFIEHYSQELLKYEHRGYSFVVGDARGTDEIAQRFLSHLPKDRVTVYHMFDSPRNLKGDFQLKGGYKSDSERDAAMTAASDIDLAWVRPGRENSGTAKNLKRRQTTK